MYVFVVLGFNFIFHFFVRLTILVPDGVYCRIGSRGKRFRWILRRFFLQDWTGFRTRSIFVIVLPRLPVTKECLVVIVVHFGPSIQRRLKILIIFVPSFYVPLFVHLCEFVIPLQVPLCLLLFVYDPINSDLDLGFRIKTLDQGKN